MRNDKGLSAQHGITGELQGIGKMRNAAKPRGTKPLRQELQVLHYYTIFRKVLYKYSKRGKLGCNPYFLWQG